MEYGRKLQFGNFVVLKYTRGLTKAERKELSDVEKFPWKIRKEISRGTLPYIKVSTVSGSWSVHFVYGTSMYDAIDELGGVLGMITPTEKQNAERLFTLMYVNTTVVGDNDYQYGCAKLLDEYLKRASKDRNKREDDGKDEKEMNREDEEILSEELDRTSTVSAITEMAEQIKKEESL